MRLVFAGTPEFAAVHLQALLKALPSDAALVGVYTQPDRPEGRGRKPKPSPVKQAALAHQCPVFQPETLKSPQAQAELAALAPDLMIVVAYGLLLPPKVLAIPRLGCINVHASLLPRWRGAAPIQRALLSGDTTTGITLMQMDSGLDTGALLYTAPCPITAEDTSASLHDKLALMGSEALVSQLPLLLAGRLQAQMQDETQACYARKLSKEEACLDWGLGALALERAVRAFNPWPVAWFSCTTPEGKTEGVRVWAAQALPIDHNAPPGTLLDVEKEGPVVACGEGCLQLTRLQRPGAKPLSANDLLNGYPDFFQPGQVLAAALEPASRPEGQKGEKRQK